MQLPLSPELPLHALVHSSWRLLVVNITFVILYKVLVSIIGVLVGIIIPRACAICLREPNDTAAEARGHVLSMQCLFLQLRHHNSRCLVVCCVGPVHL